MSAALCRPAPPPAHAGIFRLGKWLLALLVVGLAAAIGWLYLAPPALIRVAAGYSAKIVCSNVFIAGRDADEVLRVDVQAPGHPLLRYMRIDVDREGKTVTAGLLGVVGKGTAVARDGHGCTNVPDGDLDAVVPMPAAEPEPSASDALWPEGKSVEQSQDPELTAIPDDARLTGPDMRAVVVATAASSASAMGRGFRQRHHCSAGR